MTVRPSLPAAEPLELEGESQGSAGGPGEMIVRIMRAANKLGASDLHLRALAPPIVRLEGELRPLNHPPLTDVEIHGAARALAESKMQKEE